MTRRFALLATAILPLLLARAAWAGGPAIFYTDLTIGPASGGQQDQGAIVTLFGTGFGVVQGSTRVTLAGAAVYKVLRWSNEQIAVQIGATAHSGPLQVIGGQGASNTIDFTVAPGAIYLVSPQGRDQGPGDWNRPWRTIAHAAHSMRPGDITYVLDGSAQNGIDNYHASLSIQSSGLPGRPIALLAYPGAHAEIGEIQGEEFGLRTPSIRSGPFNDWLIAGFEIRGANTALRLDGVARWRVVNNDFACPHGDGAAGCVEISSSNEIDFLGNSVHDAGRNGGSKRYQSVYFTTDTNHVEVGWNRIFRNHSCRGIQFHSSPVSATSGYGQYDLAIHDNSISDQVCDGINLATIDPSRGRVLVYNNTIVHVGAGPAPPDGESSYTCINSPGIVNRGAPGTGTVEIFNNTLSDCGSQGGVLAGAFSIGVHSPDLSLHRNRVLQHGAPYFTAASVRSKVHGADNEWKGGGVSPEPLNPKQ